MKKNYIPKETHKQIGPELYYLRNCLMRLLKPIPTKKLSRDGYKALDNLNLLRFELENNMFNHHPFEEGDYRIYNPQDNRGGQHP